MNEIDQRVTKFLACKHFNVQNYTDYCLDCGENINMSVEEIMKQEAKKINDRVIPLAKAGSTVFEHSTMNTNEKKAKYSTAEALWKVTTEGDVEGRSVKDLGVHYGFIDDIAFALADQCYYSLCFKWVQSANLGAPKANKINVTLDIDSETWNMNHEQRQLFMEKLLGDRDVAVEQGQYYASVQLVMGKSEMLRKQREQEMIRQQALSKLTEEEKTLLGLA